MVTFRRFFSALLTFIMLVNILPWCEESVYANELTKTDSLIETIIQGRYEEDSYIYYRQQHINQPVLTEAISVDATAYLSEKSDNVKLENNELLFESKGTACFPVHVTSTGLYELSVQYRYVDTASLKNYDISVAIDRKIPFFEAESIELPRIWGQDALVHTKDGNDYAPSTYQLTDSTQKVLSDSVGEVGAYLFYLKEGTHEVSISLSTSGLCLQGLTFGAAEVLSDSAQAETISKEWAGEIITLEAEVPTLRNDSSISGGVDRTDAGVSPNDPLYKKINVLNGSKFSKPNQSVTYVFNVEKAGRYRVGIKYKQDVAQGLFVSRRLLIDGKSVCESTNALRFPYNDEWNYTILQTKSGDLSVDLAEGEHTLSLEVTLGDMQSGIQEMNDLLYALNYLYRKIIMVTGTSPDLLRDYDLDKEIPYLLGTLNDIALRLEDVYNSFGDMGIRSGQVSVLRQLYTQLYELIDAPYDIPARLDNFKSNISSLSSFIASLQSQPLTIDYISLIGEEKTIPYVKTGFLANFMFNFRAFLGSFYGDYSSITAEDGNKKNLETIEVWFGGGREQAELLKNIIDEQFTARQNILVNLKLVTVSLSQAILAGTAPDVHLSTSRYQPINLGARGVLQDLTIFEDYSDVVSSYEDTYMTPYTYNGSVYALPVTLDYLVMFYRTDIFEELSLVAPQTWDDLYSILPALQRNNMTVGLPYTVLSSQGVIESGIGCKDLFATLVQQKGLSLYSENGNQILLDNTNIAEVFTQWTEFYTQYGLDLEYSFYNRFRTGEMPIGIAGYTTYNLLASTAPEIKGLWKMALIPGTRQTDGTINRAVAASGNGVIMLKDSKHQDAAWSFMKWWISTEAQSTYGNELEMLMGTASRYNPLNKEAVQQLPWTEEELEILLNQRVFVQELPEVLGGYYTVRGIDNAFRNVVYKSHNAQEALSEQSIKINAEFKRKRLEFAQEE